LITYKIFEIIWSDYLDYKGNTALPTSNVTANQNQCHWSTKNGVVDTVPALGSPNLSGYPKSCCTSVEIIASGRRSKTSWCTDLFTHRNATCWSWFAMILDNNTSKDVDYNSTSPIFDISNIRRRSNFVNLY
jgi:hypothetical protein